MTTSSQVLPCPNCRAVLDLSRPDCAQCGLRLRGPEAVRLWQVDQQLASLSAERGALIRALLQPAAETAEWAPAPEFATVQHPPRSAPTGQQILLGLGAVLLLAAATFFGVVVWMIVGVWGQALLLVAMTACAVAGAVFATRRRLPAAAETAAVLACGLTAVGLWAAWSLDLAGLRDLDGLAYASLGGLIAGTLALGYHRLVPRTDRDGEPLRGIVTYLPFATTAFSFAAWSAMAYAEPQGVSIPLAFGAVAAFSLLVWWGASQFTRRAAVKSPPAISTGVAATLAVLSGLVLAHDDSVPSREWSALLMLGVAVALAVAGARGVVPGRDRWLPLLVTLIAVPAAWAFTWEAHWALLFAAGILAALAVVGLAQAPLPDGARGSMAHRCAEVALVLVGAGLTLQLYSLHLSDDPRLWNPGVGVGPQLALVAAVAAVWAVAGTWAAVRLTSQVWLVVAHIALASTLAIALAYASLSEQVVAWLTTAVLLAAVSAVLALKARSLRTWDVTVGLFAAAFAAIAVLLSIDLPHPWTAWTLIVMGAVTYAWSLLPRRLPVAYAASPVIALGIGLLVEDSWQAIEAYSLPLALVLAVTGWRHWLQDRNVHSWVSMGAALTAAFLPTTLVAIDDGDAVRLAIATLVSIVALVAGLARRWQAPVTVAGACLVLIAITQGGPYIELLPGWLTLGLAGLTLLAIGVSWERAVVAGRRSTAWWSSLR